MGVRLTFFYVSEGDMTGAALAIITMLAGKLKFADDLADSFVDLNKSRPYDRPEIETRSGEALKQEDAVDRWDEFLGPEQTNIDPRDGLPDADRIWSSDGKRSIRFGEHEMNSSPKKFHFHEETWHDDRVDNVLRRIPSQKKKSTIDEN